MESDVQQAKEILNHLYNINYKLANIKENMENLEKTISSNILVNDKGFQQSEFQEINSNLNTIKQSINNYVIPSIINRI